MTSFMPLKLNESMQAGEKQRDDDKREQNHAVTENGEIGDQPATPANEAPAKEMYKIDRPRKYRDQKFGIGKQEAVPYFGSTIKSQRKADCSEKQANVDCAVADVIEESQ